MDCIATCSILSCFVLWCFPLISHWLEQEQWAAYRRCLLFSCLDWIGKVLRFGTSFCPFGLSTTPFSKKKPSLTLSVRHLFVRSLTLSVQNLQLGFRRRNTPFEEKGNNTYIYIYIYIYINVSSCKWHLLFVLFVRKWLNCVLFETVSYTEEERSGCCFSHEIPPHCSSSYTGCLNVCFECGCIVTCMFITLSGTFSLARARTTDRL